MQQLLLQDSVYDERKWANAERVRSTPGGAATVSGGMPSRNDEEPEEQEAPKIRLRVPVGR
jgi:hypothetical protein